MKEVIRNALRKVLPESVEFDVEIPPRPGLGHYSTNAAMKLAKSHELRVKGQDKWQPIEVATELVIKLQKAAPKGLFSKIQAVQPGFVNFWIADEAVRKELSWIAEDNDFGTSMFGKGKTVITEYSQPNIAKKMHVGHLRTTALGDALANMYEALGYKVVRWNYLGDWGTQFGKLIAAYKMWGKKAEVERDPIQTLLDLYVRFHDEVKYRPELEDAGREEFKKLEEGDKENLALWKWFKEESLKEFHKIYAVLGVRFDVEIGESFFEPQMKPLVEKLLKSGVAERSSGAVIVNLEKWNLPPALVRKEDGASLYLTRDVANLEYRLEKYKPVKILYVVGNEQTLHFDQLFRVAEIMGLAKNVELTHVKYGLVLAEEGKKFATREGRVVFLEEIIQKAVKLAHEIVSKKSEDLGAEKKLEIAHAVALGALKYANLKENRHSDIRFDWGKMLDFTGDSAPYLQYTYARMRSIIAKAQSEKRKVQSDGDPKYLETEDELAIVRKMMGFPDAVQIAAETYATNHLCNYLYELAVAANKFYETTPILSARGGSSSGGKDEINIRNARLLLVATVAKVLKQGLGLLGIKTLEKI